MTRGKCVMIPTEATLVDRRPSTPAPDLPGGRRNRRLRIAAGASGVAAVLVLVALLAPVAGASPSRVDGGFQAFSDTLSYSPTDAATLASIKARCPRKAVNRTESFGAAIRHAHTYVRDHASARAISALARDADLRDPRRARLLAGAALLSDRPLGALAALLDAQRHHPYDPQTLIALSALLSRFDQPLDALAVLGPVRRFSGLPTPLGIGADAVLLNNRGLALLRLGRLKAAERALSAAAGRAPYLAEATSNLAAAKICAFGVGRVVPAPWRGDVLQPPIIAGGAQMLPIDSVFDLSQGVDGSLPDLHYPLTPSDGVAADDTFSALDLSAQRMLTTDQGTEQSSALAFLQSRPSQLTARRTGATLAAVSAADLQPQIQALRNHAFAAADTASGVQSEFTFDKAAITAGCENADDFQSCVDSRCRPVLADRHGEWLAKVHIADQAMRSYFQAAYHYQTGLAANLMDPNSHAEALAVARQTADSALMELAYEAHGWTSFERINVNCASGDGSPPPAPGGPSTPGSEPCSPALNAIKVSYQVYFVKVSAACEKFDVELSTPGPIGGFVSAGIDVHGKTTIFIGAKAGVKLSSPLKGGGVGAKTGAYVTIDSHGSVRDFGWRVSPLSVTVNGPRDTSVTASMSSMDFSMAGGLF